MAKAKKPTDLFDADRLLGTAKNPTAAGPTRTYMSRIQGNTNPRDPIFKPIRVPDRFEALIGQPKDSLGQFIIPVPQSLSALARLFENSAITGRGQLFLLESNPGVGKTTFLNTSSIFLPNVDVFSVSSNIKADDILQENLYPKSKDYGLFILEGRESVDHVTDTDLGQLLHQLNQKLRSAYYKNTVVAWPCNSKRLAARVAEAARQIGGSALLDVDVGHHIFKGPEKKEFRSIAENTISFLNDGADVVDIGIDEFTFTDLINKSHSIGDLFTKIVSEVSQRRMVLTEIQNVDRHRLWIVAASGSQPEKEIAGLTRGSNGSCDIKRLCNGTKANVVSEVKEYPDKLGLLVGYLDAKLTFVPVTTLLAVIRAFADEALLKRLSDAGTRVSIADRPDAIRRLKESQLSTLLRGEEIGLLGGQVVGSDTKKAFAVITTLAQSNDRPFNKAFAEGLVAANLIKSYELEVDFGVGLTRRTDIVASSEAGTIRLEMMWSKVTSKAGLANYSLTKLMNYGRALGFLRKTIISDVAAS